MSPEYNYLLRMGYAKVGGVPEHRMAGGQMGKRVGKIAYRRDELDAFRAGR